MKGTDGCVVQVATPEKYALNDPAFVIESDGRFYVAVAVLEFDPNAPDITPEEKEGVEQVSRMVRDGTAGVRGARIPGGWDYSRQNTSPQNIDPQPRSPQNIDPQPPRPPKGQ